MFLAISVVLLSVGPLLGWALSKHSRTWSGVDGLVVVTVTGLVVCHVLPDAIAGAGVWALIMAALGLLLVPMGERIIETTGVKSRGIWFAAAALGLFIHGFVDGMALTDSHHGDAHGEAPLALAVTLHRVPMSLAVWWLARPRIGVALSVGLLVTEGIATIAGHSFTELLLSKAALTWVSAAQALAAGGLLHVVLHRVQSPGHEPQPRAAGVGGLLGFVIVAAVAIIHPLAINAPGALGAGETFLALAYQTAPALLLGLLLAGFFNTALPQMSTGWLSRGSSLSQALRGVAVGLPLPLCSCGVLPAYRALVRKGAPAAAGFAFLVATPEIGIDAVLVSLPLLGVDMAIARVVCAAALALSVALITAHLAKPKLAPASTHTCHHDHHHEHHHEHDHAPKAHDDGCGGHETCCDTEAPRTRRAKIVASLRFGLSDMVEHTMPWVIVGLVLAAFIEPLLDEAFSHAVASYLQIPFFAMVGIPLYVCASGATPLVAVLLHKGISAGAAITFLLTGPATNISTIGVVAALYGRRTAMVFTAVVILAAIALGFAVDALVVPSYSGFHETAVDEVTPVQVISLAVLVLATLRVLLNCGPRRLFEQLLSFGADSHAH